ncbi:MAG TPA: hypothetical protein VNK26_00395 [Pyrinomonadaceae bacterium]|nr:hypothetical protein [Pyrinomonadaceae bacterium]
MRRRGFIFALTISIAILIPIAGYGQKSVIGQFAIWKPKDGMESKFELGYKAHLEWHRVNGDKWDWYGWYIISGPRYGQFVDATLDHAWQDYDNAIKPAEDIADNRKNVFANGELQSVFKVELIPSASSHDSYKVNSRLVRLITIKTVSLTQALTVIEKLYKDYKSKNVRAFYTFKLRDGGNLSEIILLIGFENWQQLAITDSLLEEIEKIQTELKIKPINSIFSETLVYRADMSYFPNDIK